MVSMLGSKIINLPVHKLISNFQLKSFFQLIEDLIKKEKFYPLSALLIPHELSVSFIMHKFGSHYKIQSLTCFQIAYFKKTRHFY